MYISVRNQIGLGLIVALISVFARTSHAGSFAIDFNNNTFVKDGKPFRYVSGSIHSYRVPRPLWQDRLDKMWAAGLNAVQVYIFWNEHEPYPGQYDFEGQNDVFAFIELAQKTGFVVILRPGPYACAEHEFGGMPWWLLTSGQNKVTPRTYDPVFMAAVERYYAVLLPRMAPYLYINGGPIITVQVENEYGSYYACDNKYLGALRDIFRQHLGDDVVLFTTDPDHDFILNCGTVKDVYPTVDFGTSTDPAKAFALQRKFAPKGPLVNGDSVGYLKCGTVRGAYSTVDFGPGSDVKSSFAAQRAYEPKGPLVNSEFYPGWLDIWGVPHQKVKTSDVLKTFTKMMDMGANVNFYMFFGGTNFGFSNGADPPYLPQPTTYDYDAPMSEAGDITDKYLAIRDTIAKYLPVPQVPIPGNSTKRAYGVLPVQYLGQFADVVLQSSNEFVKSPYPLKFEDVGQGYGFLMYRTELSDPDVDGQLLSLQGVRDRAYVQIGNRAVGVVYRNTKLTLTIDLKNNTNTSLIIFVENMGRLNFGNNYQDSKGLISNVTLNGVVLKNWQIYLTKNFIPNYQMPAPPSFSRHSHEQSFIRKLLKERLMNTNEYKDIDYNAAAVYAGVFDSGDAADTFIRMNNFKKGIVLVQSKDTITNLGRYWPHTGPQITLYVPSVVLTPSYPNILVLIEFEGSLCNVQSQCFIELLDTPQIDGPVFHRL